MAEKVGLVFKAGMETAKSGKEVFRLGLSEGENDWEWTLFSPDLIATAKKLKNKMAKVTAEKKGDFWNVEAIEASDEPMPDTGQTVPTVAPVPPTSSRTPDQTASIEGQVAAKIVAELWATDKLDRESLEVKMLRAWIADKLPAVASDKTPVKKAEPPKGSGSNWFILGCLLAGWDPSTENGKAAIAMWKDEHGWFTPWADMNPDGQKRMTMELLEGLGANG